VFVALTPPTAAAPHSVFHPSPFLRDRWRHRATLPGRVDDLDVIRGELDQISQGTRLDDGRVSDEVVLKIHRLHGLCEGDLVSDERGGGEKRDTLSVLLSAPLFFLFLNVHTCHVKVLKVFIFQGIYSPHNESEEISVSHAMIQVQHIEGGGGFMLYESSFQNF